MKNFIVIILLVFVGSSLTGQTKQLKKMHKEIKIYKGLSNYAFVQTYEENQDFLDTVDIEFGLKDSLILVLPVTSTYGFANLFRIEENAIEKEGHGEGNAFQFIQFVIYKSKTNRFKIEFEGCHSKSTVILNIIG